MNIDLRNLIGKLTPTARVRLEAAVGACSSRTHYEVEPEHWLACLLEHDGEDLARVCRRSGVLIDRLRNELASALDRLKTGNGKSPALSPDVEGLLRDAWVLTSVNYGWSRVRSGVLAVAALGMHGLGRRLREVCPSLREIDTDKLAAILPSVVAGASEDREIAPESFRAATSVDREPAPTLPMSTPALDQFSIDLTAAARGGKIDAIFGRDAEIRQVIDILMRRRQNNPILVGEAGVGKTAVAEGFAMRIARGDVPPPLRHMDVRTLDLGLLQAGAGVKGEFENRLKQVIAEVRAAPRPIILFIDEAHTLIGAGGQEGQSDAANLLKPALARGELRTVAATTWTEYKKYFERDPALSRRFQVVKIDEPDQSSAIAMMRGVKDALEAHHGVAVLDEALVEAVRLSSRYIPARQLPDKSVSVLDTACARVAIGRVGVPPMVEDLRRRLEIIGTELRVLAREAALGNDNHARTRELMAERDTTGARLSEVESKWAAEKALVESITALGKRLTADMADTTTPAERGRLVAELARQRAELRSMQGEKPLVQADVDGQTVAQVVAAWTGIPVGRMLADDIRAVCELPHRLAERVLGQDTALEAIAARIRTARAKLDNPARPVGVFLLVGPSGVGKTETALALAESLYGGERNLISINMSEYQEAHTVSGLKGAPPGYVGFGEGGVLTEAVRRRPHSVVLLDEFEKAHADVMELFFQVFDKGVLEDGEGREIDFRNTVILLTSNVGAETIMQRCAAPASPPEPAALVEAIRPELLRHFPTALLGRLVVVPFHPIAPPVLERIVHLQLARIVERVRLNHGAELTIGDGVAQSIAKRCREHGSGVREVDQILTHGLLPTLAAAILARASQGRGMARATVQVHPAGGLDVQVE